MLTTRAIVAAAILAGCGVRAAAEPVGPPADLDRLAARLPEHDHPWMMFATVQALSESEREYLEPELELLVTVYTTFPDQNWSNQGEWGGWSGLPDAGRTPNDRRAWGISRACGFSPVSRQGKPLSLHSPPGSYEAVEVLFPRIVGLLKEGRHGDAIRVLGAMSHAIQDSATFPHMQALHRAAHFRFRDVAIPEYQPVKRGDAPEEAAHALAARTEQMVRFTEELASEIRAAMAQGDEEKNSALRVRCAGEAAKVVADAIHTAILLAGPKPDVGRTPPNTDLIVNGSVEQDDFGEPWPAGWVAQWNDPMDRLGRLEWAGLIARNQTLWRSGRHSLKVMWANEKGLQWCQTWPAAVWVEPGERYRATAWVKTAQATGETDVALEFATRSAQPVATLASDAIAGDREWTQLSVEGVAPPRAERLRIALRSRSNNGAAWFDDVALVRLEPGGAPNESIQPKAAKSDDLMLWLSFDEASGTYVQDRSSFSGVNGPNLLASAGVPSDLFVSEGLRGAAVRLDGKDDFVECPASYVQDVQCPKEAMTLMLWVWAEEHRDAVLVAKEQRLPDQPARGYSLRLGAEGRVRFTIHTDQGPVAAESAGPLPVDRWAHVAGVRSPENQLTVYVDGRPGAMQKATGRPLPPQATGSGLSASLYLGADAGVRDFFAGRLDEVHLLNRALDAEEIGKRAAIRLVDQSGDTP